MLKRLRSWSRLRLAVLAMFSGVLLFGVSAPCTAGPMASPAAMPMSMPASMPANHQHGGQPCCGDAPMSAAMVCPVGCTTLAPLMEPPAPSPAVATAVQWSAPAQTLQGLAAPPDDPPPR